MTYYRDGFFIYAEEDRQRNRAEGRNSHGGANYVLEPVARIMVRSGESSDAAIARGDAMCAALNGEQVSA